MFASLCPHIYARISKDLVNLVTQLINSVKDRRVASELLKIQSLISTLQSEQASQHETNDELREENQNLKDEIHDLQRQIDELTSPGGSVPTDVPRCPNCSTSGKPFFMRSIPRDFVEIENATHECSQCQYKTRIQAKTEDSPRLREHFPR